MGDPRREKNKVLKTLARAGIVVSGGVGISGNSISVGVLPGSEKRAEQLLREAGIKSPLRIKGVELVRKLIKPVKD